MNKVKLICAVLVLLVLSPVILVANIVLMIKWRVGPRRFYSDTVRWGKELDKEMKEQGII